MSRWYNELGSGEVYTPSTATVIHFGSPAGATYNNEEDDNE